jgi:hypothetical protein
VEGSTELSSGRREIGGRIAVTIGEGVAGRVKMTDGFHFIGLMLIMNITQLRDSSWRRVSHATSRTRSFS